jgi:hypothetical protein
MSSPGFDRAIQYSGNSRFITGFPAYWIHAFAGMRACGRDDGAVTGACLRAGYVPPLSRG